MRTVQLILRGIALCSASGAFAQSCADLAHTENPSRGRISRNFYRIPYLNDGFPVHVGTHDYWGHGGSFDMGGTSPTAYLVAPADGFVCYILEDMNDCGCSGSFGGCGNQLIIAHANGEYSRHLHIAQWSVSEAGLHVGDPVFEGQVVCREGDVGNTCSTGGSLPRIGTCLTTLPPISPDFPRCARHDHWNIVQVIGIAANGDPITELLQPMTCGVPGNLYAPEMDYMPASCNASLCTQTPVTLSSYVVDGLGQSRVVQNADAITATTAEIRNQATAVFHAGNRVRFLPGFKAGAGDVYFRAEIGPCSQTAP